MTFPWGWLTPDEEFISVAGVTHGWVARERLASGPVDVDDVHARLDAEFAAWDEAYYRLDWILLSHTDDRRQGNVSFAGDLLQNLRRTQRFLADVDACANVDDVFLETCGVVSRWCIVQFDRFLRLRGFSIIGSGRSRRHNERTDRRP